MRTQSDVKLLGELLKVNSYADATQILTATSVPLDPNFCEKVIITVEQLEEGHDANAPRFRQAFNYVQEFRYRLAQIDWFAPLESREFVNAIAAQPSEEAMADFVAKNRKRFDANIVGTLRAYMDYKESADQATAQQLFNFSQFLINNMTLKLSHNPPSLYRGFINNLYSLYKKHQMVHLLKKHADLVDLLFAYTVAGSTDNMRKLGILTPNFVHFVESLAMHLANWEVGKADFNDVAIYLYQYLLTLYDPQQNPDEYARTLANLGFVNGKKGKIGEARRHFEDGLGLPISSPDIRLHLLLLLGQSYEQSADTTGGAEDYRRAAECYREGLALLPRDNPKWLELSFYMAQNIIRNRSHTLEELRKAYELLKRCEEAWAGTDAITHAFVLDLLGAVLLEIPGDRAANVEQAITYLEQAESALKLRVLEVRPLDRAIVQNRLGHAYRVRVAGDNQQNLQVAVRCFRKAAEVCPPEVDLNEYLTAITNLAIVLGESEQIEDVREGIRLIEKSLEYDAPGTWPLDYATDLLEKANLHLQAHNLGAVGELEATLQSIQTALEVPEVQNDEVLLAGLLTNYGEVVLQMPEMPAEAETLLRRAVEVADSTSGVGEIVAIARLHLGQFFARHGQKADALNLYCTAIKAFEAHIGSESTPEFLTHIERRTGHVYEAIVEQLIELERYAEALNYLERNKARSLSLMVESRVTEPSKEVSTELVQEYHDLRERKRYLETRSRLLRFGSRPVSQELADVQQMRPEITDVIRVADVEVLGNQTMLKELEPRLVEVIRKIREQDPDFEPVLKWSNLSVEEIQGLVAPERAIIEFIITESGAYLFVMTTNDAGGVAIRVFAPPQASRSSLRKMAEKEWLEPYHLYREAIRSGSPEAKKLRKAWRSTIEDIGPRMASVLEFQIVLEWLTNAGVKEIVFVPYQIFHVLPLHLLPGVNGGYLCDEYEISYAPSLRILAQCRRRTGRGRSKAFVVQNPDGSLVFSDLEVRLIKQFFSDPNALEGAECRWESVQSGMTGAEIFHYSGHAFFEPRNPLASSLVLSDRSLTLGEIMASSNLPLCSMVVLSACETNQVSYFLPADEYTGLPGGFLYAGAPTVLGTLWVVEDNSGPLFMHEFYRNFITLGVGPTEAFKAATKRIRTVTADDILNEFDKPDVNSDPALRRLLVFSRNKKNKAEPLFDHPEYWAAFNLVGSS